MPVVVVTGARQTGKSTLVQRFGGAGSRRYETLDDLTTLELAERDPQALLQGRQALTLDEVQRVPSLLLAIKREVDRDRRRGRFLLTGSANLLLMERVAESLAGRAVYMTLWPMTLAEAGGRSALDGWPALLEAGSAQEALERIAASPRAVLDLDGALLRGGYPPAVTALDDSERRLWFDGYVRTYLERDLQRLAQIVSLVEFRRLMQAAALRVGQLLNQAEIARDAGLAPATAHRYLNLLEVSCQLHRLPAYSVNRTKRLIKSPKAYWTDTGLAAFLAGVEGRVAASERGPLLENLVLCHLLAWRELLTPRPELTYWRTASGEEVDFVIETGGRLLPIEVKSTARPTPRAARGLAAFLLEYPRAAPFGVVAHSGDECRLLARNVVALPLAALLG